MERREHWDDDLIEAAIKSIYPVVSKHVQPHHAVCIDAADVYAVIAVVEDWHRDRWTGVCESPEEVVRELKQAQAALQRVRELHRIGVSHDICVCCHQLWPCPTIRTLDGGAE